MGSQAKLMRQLDYIIVLDLKPEYFEACFNLASSLRRIGAIEPRLQLIVGPQINPNSRLFGMT